MQSSAQKMQMIQTALMKDRSLDRPKIDPGNRPRLSVRGSNESLGQKGRVIVRQSERRQKSTVFKCKIHHLKCKITTFMSRFRKQ